MNDPVTVIVVVLADNAEGVPKLVPVRVTCTREQYDDGEHYDHAKSVLIDDEWEVKGCLDENDDPRSVAAIVAARGVQYASEDGESVTL